MEAIIVGAGIGGLSAAIALRRAGARVTVLERAPELGEVGAGLTLMANAMRGLDALGVGDAVRAEGRVDASGGTRDASGRWLARVDADRMEELLGTRAIGIHRATLHRILRAHVDAEIITGAEVRDVTADGTVTVGGDTLRADLVVGADGLRSTVRERLWPGQSRVTYAGSATWRGVTDERWTGELLVGVTWGRGEEFGMVPLVDGRVYWWGAVAAPEHSEADLVRFTTWHDPIPALIAATSTVLRHHLYHLTPPLRGYVTGRVALLGDAAHAMTPNLGQGAAQAIEDAVELGRTADRLAEYDRRRRPRSQRVARASYRVGQLGYHLSNPVAVAVRNAAMRWTPPDVALRSMTRYVNP